MDTEGTGAGGNDGVPLTPPPGGSAGSGGGAGLGAGATLDTTVTMLGLGSGISEDLQDALDALSVVTLQGNDRDGLTEAKLDAFLKSSLGQQLTGGNADAEALGRAVAALLITPSGNTAAVVRALFDIDDVTLPPTPLVFVQEKALEGKLADFQNGLISAIGESDARSAFVELSDLDPSFVPDYKRERIPTVDNIEQASGQAAFSAIILRGAEGNFGTKPTADSTIRGGVIEAKTSSFATEIDSEDALSSSTSYILLITLVMGSAAWAAVGMRSARRRRRRSTR